MKHMNCYWVKSCIFLLLAWLILGLGSAWGGSLTVTKEWSQGETLNAADLNQNFTDTETEVSDNDGRITNIETQTQNLVSGCPSGQSIRSIGADGSISCEVITNQLVIQCSTESNVINTISTTTSNVASVSIVAPAPGTVYVTVSGMFRISGSYDGSSFHAAISLANTSASFDYNASNYWGPFSGGLPTGINYDIPFHEQKDFSVTGAGTYTYYATALLLTAPTAGSVYAGKSKLCALFIPQ